MTEIQSIPRVYLYAREEDVPPERVGLINTLVRADEHESLLSMYKRAAAILQAPGNAITIESLTKRSEYGWANLEPEKEETEIEWMQQEYVTYRPLPGYEIVIIPAPDLGDMVLCYSTFPYRIKEEQPPPDPVTGDIKANNSFVMKGYTFFKNEDIPECLSNSPLVRVDTPDSVRQGKTFNVSWWIEHTHDMDRYRINKPKQINPLQKPS